MRRNCRGATKHLDKENNRTMGRRNLAFKLNILSDPGVQKAYAEHGLLSPEGNLRAVPGLGSQWCCTATSLTDCLDGCLAADDP